MSTRHEVISAFLDDELFDPQELTDALSDPAGRALLIDLIQLRKIVQPVDAMAPMRPATAARRSPWRAAVAAAALFVALASGYLIGERRSVPGAVEAPQPTRVVQAVPFTPTGEVR